MMLDFVRKRWFLISLLVLISSGLAIGANSSGEQVRSLTGFIPPRALTAFVLFLMSLSLDSRQLRASVSSPGPVVWASLVNFGFIPLAAWAVSFGQLTPDFAIGLMIAASVPCTMAAASVWTRKAGGNDAVSLMVTVGTNGLCFLITPFWLNLTTSTANDVQLDVTSMIVRLLSAVLIPTLAGQAIRQISSVADFATKHKTLLGVVAQGCILIIVFSAACGAGVQIGERGVGADLGGAALVWGTCIMLHLVAMFVGVVGARCFRFPRGDQIAVAFASSQKTLPIGILLATDQSMFGDPNLLGPGVGVPFALFPMLMYHASQLFIDTAIADRFAKKTSVETNADASTGG